ncbi:hypothetical protein MLD38_038809 [Melastoma candidum]|uniref:Uncharacterized protein n=1 Tax=Melastoma candidum TaxID=119954 RepID=A0ACB9L0X0_9MYRT|nr:hypothetical protein MLD38_038809 [Melastoma candidum]
MKAQLFSSNFPIHHHHTPSQSPPNFPTFLRPSSSITRHPPCASNRTPQSPQLPGASTQEVPAEEAWDDRLLVRRPIMESGDEDDGEGDGDDEEDGVGRTAISDRLSEMARKMPMFEPERGEVTGGKEEKLVVNLDLALYKAKVLGRKFEFAEAQKILEKCIYYWPEDGRAYVTLGKMLSKQKKMAEARGVYEKGCQATQGENPYIWQCWAVLENRLGNVRKARELFDAAIVADKKHVAAWHGWAVLELKQGNVKKARQLLAKGLKFCGANEYIYQTLALLEVKSNRPEQARYLFNQATRCNPKSCASWLAWAQLEVQQDNNEAARLLFEKAVQASPKNRFAWHVWGVFEAKMGNIEKSRKLLLIGHKLNPRDPVLLQSLALLEYRNSATNLARSLFKRAAEIDPRHQPVWIAWGWVEWKEGNVSTARTLYQKALSIDSTSESAARCLQAWGVLEQRLGNLSAARRLFRSSLDINSQSYVTWMTWASLEEQQGNSIRAEEIRDLYFQQRTEVVDDSSWMMGFMDIIDPAVDSIKRLLKLDKSSSKLLNFSGGLPRDEENVTTKAALETPGSPSEKQNATGRFDLDTFVREQLSLEPTELNIQTQPEQEGLREGNNRPYRRVRRLVRDTTQSTA